MKYTKYQQKYIDEINQNMGDCNPHADAIKIIGLLEKVIDAKDEILVAYRLGKKPTEKALDLLQKFKQSNY